MMKPKTQNPKHNSFILFFREIFQGIKGKLILIINLILSYIL